MPYRIDKVKGGYKVINADTLRVHAKHSTLKNANRQVHLLQAIDHGWKPKRKKIIVV